uniref:Uncharacterized protein n=1 Tax=Arundo donax TaxID=35708 RepID=A0A0A9GBU3_ARUDO
MLPSETTQSSYSKASPSQVKTMAFAGCTSESETLGSFEFKSIIFPSFRYSITPPFSLLNATQSPNSTYGM